MARNCTKLVSNTNIPCCFIDYVIFIIVTSYAILRCIKLLVISKTIYMRNIQFVTNGVCVTVEWLSFEEGH